MWKVRTRATSVHGQCQTKGASAYLNSQISGAHKFLLFRPSPRAAGISKCRNTFKKQTQKRGSHHGCWCVYVRPGDNTSHFISQHSTQLTLAPQPSTKFHFQLRQGLIKGHLFAWCPPPPLSYTEWNACATRSHTRCSAPLERFLCFFPTQKVREGT